MQAQAINEIVDQEVKAGVPSERVVVGGFSQGAREPTERRHLFNDLTRRRGHLAPRRHHDDPPARGHRRALWVGSAPQQDPAGARPARPRDAGSLFTSSKSPSSRTSLSSGATAPKTRSSCPSPVPPALRFISSERRQLRHASGPLGRVCQERAQDDRRPVRELPRPAPLGLDGGARARRRLLHQAPPKRRRRPAEDVECMSIASWDLIEECFFPGVVLVQVEGGPFGEAFSDRVLEG